MTLSREKPSSHSDVRDWLGKAEQLGEFKFVREATRDLEMGGLAEIVAREAKINS